MNKIKANNVLCVFFEVKGRTIKVYLLLNVPLEIWDLKIIWCLFRKAKYRTNHSLPPPKRATWDLVEEVENQVALNFCHSHTDLDASLEGKDKDERQWVFLLLQLTLAGMEPGTPLSPQATLGPSSSWRVSPLN